MHFTIDENPTYWVLWLLTLLVIVHQIVCSIRTQAGILGFVPVVCAMFG